MPTTGQFMLERLIAVGRRAHLRLSRATASTGILGALPRAPGTSSSSCRCATRRWPRSWRCAHAKFTGEVGVCLATSGPGAIHLLNGLYDAKLDHQPVVAIVGQQARDALGGDYQQEVDLQRCSRTWRTSSSRWSPSRRRCATWSTARCGSRRRQRDRDLHDRPERRAGDGRGRSRRASTARPLGHRLTRPARRPARRRPAARRRRAQRRREGRDAGRRTARSTPADEVIEVAELLGAGVAKALLGKAALPDDLPFVTGSIGLLGHEAELGHDDGLRHAADGRLELPVLRVPAEGGPGARRADRHRRRACSASATRWRSTSSATPARRCARCIPLLERKARPRVARADRGRTSRAGGSMHRGAGACSDANPINPQRVFWELSPRLPDGAILDRRLGLGGELVRARPRVRARA